MSNAISLDALREMYPWPVSRPVASEPFVDKEGVVFGWPLPENILGSNLNGETCLVVELGTFLGKSARFILNHAPNATIICVDHWKGSPEHGCFEVSAKILPTLYEDFLSVNWDLRDRIIPVRETTIEGMRIIAELCLVPDLVYIDAAHDYDSVKADIETANRLFPHSTIVGDDYLGLAVIRDEKVVDVRYDVRRAVNHFIYERGWDLRCTGRGWQLIRKPSKNGSN